MSDPLKDLLKEQGTQVVQVGPGQAVKVSLDANGEVVKEVIQLKSKPLDGALVTKANKRFEWLINFLICRYHFVHRTLGMMTKIPMNQIPTMGVRVIKAGKFELAYNPEWFESLSDTAAVYVFNHEILHLLLHHCTTRQFDDHGLGNVAHDLAVNELIVEVPGVCERPKDADGNPIGCFVDVMKQNPFFKDIEHKQTSEWYYDYLRRKQTEQKGKGKKSKSDKSDGDGDDGNSSSQSLGTTFDDHGGFGEHEIADERVRALVREIDSCAMWGNMAAGDVEVVLQAQVKKVNWRNKMRSWWGNQLAKIKYSTVKRPNRRFGYLMPGSKRGYEDTWLVAADTSGSTWSYDLIGQWLNVINQIAEEGVPIDFMQCDCEVQQKPVPYDRRQVKLEFKGMGGTSMEPVFKMVEERKYRGVMILTDGEFSPIPKPSNVNVLWALPKGKNPPVDWGERIHLERV